MGNGFRYLASFSGGPIDGGQQARVWHASHPPLVIGVAVQKHDDGTFDEAIYRWARKEGQYDVFEHDGTVRR